MPDRITIRGRNGAFDAYIVEPKSSPAPAVVVLQEVFVGTMDRTVRLDSERLWPNEWAPRPSNKSM